MEEERDRGLLKPGKPELAEGHAGQHEGRASGNQYKEVVARLNKNWDEDAAAFDGVYTHILHMSDTLSDGSSKQFLLKF